MAHIITVYLPTIDANGDQVKDYDNKVDKIERWVAFRTGGTTRTTHNMGTSSDENGILTKEKVQILQTIWRGNVSSSIKLGIQIAEEVKAVLAQREVLMSVQFMNYYAYV